jgi:hypothetical protein
MYKYEGISARTRTYRERKDKHEDTSGVLEAVRFEKSSFPGEPSKTM